MTYWYQAETHTIAERHGIPVDLVTAVVWAESSGLTHAYRYEPAFWRRYLEGKPEWDGSNPARVSASYGLMQVMFPVAVEFGYPRTDPPEHLFVPLVGLEYGCKVLAERIAWAQGHIEAALAAYNGGKGGNAPGGLLRNAGYANKVLRFRQKIGSDWMRA